MKRGLLVFLAICAFAIAMVHRDRRGTTVCERHTPCAWSVYTQLQKIIEYNITNHYCRCGAGTICVQDEDDLTAAAYVYRCRKPGHGENKADN